MPGPHPQKNTKPRQRKVDLHQVYERAALASAGDRNPVVVIPGILGSRLVVRDTFGSLWGDFGRTFVRPEGAGRRAVTLPMKSDTPLHKLRGEARSDGTLGRVSGSLFGISIRPQLYNDVLRAVGVGSYADTYASGSVVLPDAKSDADSMAFEFDYDWRRSLDETAVDLHRFLKAASRLVRAQRGDASPVKFDLIAHSMGGLLARYFLRYGGEPLPSVGEPPPPDWAGASYVDRVLIVGTPNGGSLFALDALTNGLEKTPIYPAYDASITGTCPAIYQLLPRVRHNRVVRSDKPSDLVDLFNADVWDEMGWGLLDPKLAGSIGELLPGVASEAERHDIALDHTAKCLNSARSLHLALDRASTPPDSLRYHYFVGDSIPTPELATIAPRLPVRLTEWGAGDGTVLRSSVLLDERAAGTWTQRVRSPLKWHSLTFLSRDHKGLMGDRAFLDKALYLLLESPP